MCKLKGDVSMETFAKVVICIFAFLTTSWLTLIISGLLGGDEAAMFINAGLLGVVITLCAMIYGKLDKPNKK